MPDLSQTRATPISRLSSNSGGSVKLSAAPVAARLLLRGVDAAAPTSRAFGVPLPAAPCRANANASRAALWLGPDEWLLIAPATEGLSLMRTLEAALTGSPHALVDVSHRQTALLVEGPGAEDLLNTGTPLDLSPAAFPVGAVARTIFEKAEIVLWRQGALSFRVEVWRSFAPYVLALLEAASAEFGAV